MGGELHTAGLLCVPGRACAGSRRRIARSAVTLPKLWSPANRSARGQPRIRSLVVRTPEIEQVMNSVSALSP